MGIAVFICNFAEEVTIRFKSLPIFTPEPVIFVCLFLCMYICIYLCLYRYICTFLNISCRNHFEIQHVACYILLEKVTGSNSQVRTFPSKSDIELWIFDQFWKLDQFVEVEIWQDNFIEEILKVAIQQLPLRESQLAIYLDTMKLNS